jgi:hypothetical protein
VLHVTQAGNHLRPHLTQDELTLQCKPNHTNPVIFQQD